MEFYAICSIFFQLSLTEKYVFFLNFSNSHGDVSRRHRREATSGYDWWLPDVTQRRGRGDGHVTLLTLSASELSLVRQLSLLLVTSLLEKHCERQVSVSIINNLAR